MDMWTAHQCLTIPTKELFFLDKAHNTQPYHKYHMFTYQTTKNVATEK